MAASTANSPESDIKTFGSIKSRKIRSAGISGSPRAQSYNTAALRALRDMRADTIEIDIFTLEVVPLFSEDVEAKG